MAFACSGKRLVGHQGGQQGHGPLQSGLTEPVVGPLSLLTALHDTGFAQDLHVIGKAGLGQLHRLLQHAGALFPAAQLLQNGKALGVAQSPEYLGVFLKVAVHVRSSHQNYLMRRTYHTKARLSRGLLPSAAEGDDHLSSTDVLYLLLYNNKEYKLMEIVITMNEDITVSSNKYPFLFFIQTFFV